MPSKKTIWATVCFSALLAAFAWGRTCTEVFEDLAKRAPGETPKYYKTRDLTESIFSDTDRSAIANAWKSSAVPAEKVDRTIDEYVELRTRGLSGEAKASVRRSVLKRKRAFKFLHGDVEAAYNLVDKSFVLPKKPTDEGTALLQVAILAHEIEHAVADALATIEMGPAYLGEGTLGGNPSYVRSVFLCEASAMASESEILFSIPDARPLLENLWSERLRAANMPESEFIKLVSERKIADSKLTTTELKALYLMKESVGDGTPAVRDYLKKMWAFSRYDLVSLRDHKNSASRLLQDIVYFRSRRRDPPLILSIPIGVAILSYVGARSSCAWLKTKLSPSSQ